MALRRRIGFTAGPRLPGSRDRKTDPVNLFEHPCPCRLPQSSRGTPPLSSCIVSLVYGTASSLPSRVHRGPSLPATFRGT